MTKFKNGDVAFIVENNRYVREVNIIRSSGGLYLIRFGSTGIQVKEHRLFFTEEEAKSSIFLESLKKSKTPYDWE